MKTPIEITVDALVKSAEAQKALDIIAYDVSETSSVTDFVLLISATNKIHCKSLLRELEDSAMKTISTLNSIDFYDMPKKIGTTESGWVILDLNSIIVHIFEESTREHYQIDDLYEKKSVVYHN